MAFMYIKGNTHDRMSLFKAQHHFKSMDEAINELLDCWESIP